VKFPVANDSHSPATAFNPAESLVALGIKQLGMSARRFEDTPLLGWFRANNAQCELDAAMTAVAEATCVFSE
jgi:HPt (histidine-containing phosphotransfer) domain-containing protein